MAKHHLIISGTGRAGTTFLVQLLTELGLDTGFPKPWSGVLAACNAGMEYDLREPDAPYVVKSPWLCDYLGEVVAGGQVVIDHALVPVRDLYAAAQSRRDVAKRSGPTAPPDQVAGGLWHTQDPDEQEGVLARQLYKLVYALARHDIPTTLLQFPTLVIEADYLYRRIGPVLAGIGYDAFQRAFRAVSRPHLVHDFRADDPDPLSHARN
jgi:hypothetical protein